VNTLNLLRPTTGSNHRNQVGGLSENTPSFNSTQKVPKVTNADEFVVKGATTSHGSCVQGTRVIRKTGDGSGYGMMPAGDEDEAISYEY
jgi:hypothetical protein